MFVISTNNRQDELFFAYFKKKRSSEHMFKNLKLFVNVLLYYCLWFNKHKKYSKYSYLYYILNYKY